MLGAADTVDPDLPTLLLEPYTMMDIDVEDSETLSEPSSPPPVLSEPSPGSTGTGTTSARVHGP